MVKSQNEKKNNDFIEGMSEFHKKVLSIIDFTGEEYEDYNPKCEELKEFLRRQIF